MIRVDNRITDLKKAWKWREESGIFLKTRAVRVFHGPGEGRGGLSDFTVDRFGDSYWVTRRQRNDGRVFSEESETVRVISEFLKSKSASCAVLLDRPRGEVPGAEPQILFGAPTREGEIVEEMGARYRVRFLGTRHPGLFLDHAPLRQWLRANSKDRRVLNAFAYTGSLSVAAGLGGAANTVTLDLAKPAIAWARENWALNELPDTKAKFIAGDVFERLPKFKRQARQFDCVILDPPSFARTKRGSFSTAKDLKKLHALAMAVLAPGGILVTSINSENVSWEKFEAEVFSAVRESRRRAEALWKINLPESFPTRPGCEEDCYLKGLVLRVQGLS